MITGIFPYYSFWASNFIEIFIVVLEKFRCQFSVSGWGFYNTFDLFPWSVFSKTHKGKLGQITVNSEYTGVWLV